MPKNDDCLLKAVARGEPGSCARLMQRYEGLVWSLARRLSRRSVDAEDAVQDVFVAIWQSADRFDPTMGSETTFVATIARRRLIDRVRRESRRATEVEIKDNLTHNGDTGEHDRVHRNEEAERVESLISSLSPDQQRVLRLSILHGASHDKIAQSTGLPLGTVKTHIRRGLIRLREQLEAKQEQAETLRLDRRTRFQREHLLNAA